MSDVLTTGQMIDVLQVGETAVAQEDMNVNVIRNELGYYYTFKNDKKKAWRLLTMDSRTVKLTWKILKETD